MPNFKTCGLLILCLSVSATCCAQTKPASSALPRSTPESQGISSRAILDFLESADSKINTMHSFMLMRNGNVVAEAWWSPESPDKPHILWSLSKSFTSTAMGLAIEEGKLSLDDKVIDFFPKNLPPNPSDNLVAMTVKDLLTMSTGHENEAPLRGKTDWISAFLAHPVPHRPGTQFRYNTPATFIQSAIVQKVTGQNLSEYLQSRLFEPLEIPKPRWDKNPQGISIGGYGLYLKTEDIAKFGQLYLQKGKWLGKQLVPADWIEKATSKQVPNGSNPNSDWNQGYGFQFWRCRNNAYRGDGRDGQFCIVMPDQNAVIAITAKTGDLQGQLNLVWEKLLPAFKDSPLPENAEDLKKLQEAIAKLKVFPKT